MRTVALVVDRPRPIAGLRRRRGATEELFVEVGVLPGCFVLLVPRRRAAVQPTVLSCKSPPCTSRLVQHKSGPGPPCATVANLLGWTGHPCQNGTYSYCWYALWIPSGLRTPKRGWPHGPFP